MIVFVKTRHHYDSYIDFWRLVEAAKFETCFVDEIVAADDSKTYIFTPMNGEVVPHLQSQIGAGVFQLAKRAKIIWWNLERPTSDPTTSGSIDALKGFIDEIWVSDRWCANQDSRFKYVLMAGHPDFGTRKDGKVYDICTLAYLWGRRKAICDELASKGWAIAPSAYGRDQQDAIVARSRLMLNLHQYEDSPLVAPIRFAVAASYAIPIVSEWLNDLQSIQYTILTGENLVGPVDQLLREFARHFDSAGSDLFRKMCVETDFRREVERALHA